MFSTTDKEIQDMNNGEWEIYCPEMVLAKNDGSESWKGTGTIRLSHDRVLSYCLYAPCENPESTAFLSVTSSIDSKEPDKFLVEESGFYTLTAIDLKCRLWESKYLSSPTFSADSYPMLTVSGKLNRADCHADTRGAHRALFAKDEEIKNLCYVCYEFGEYQFPATDYTTIETKVAGKGAIPIRHLDSARFSVSGFDFVLSQSDCGVRIEAFSEKPEKSPEVLLANIRESLQFVLGRPIEWDVVTYNCNVDEYLSVVSWKKKSGTTRTPPPINHSHLPSENKAVWKLFGCYLAHVQKQYSGDEYSKMATRLWNIMQGSSSSWSAEKLTLGTEIEGLVQDFFKGEITPPLPMQVAAEMVATLVKDSRSNILCAVDKKTLRAILGVLGGLKTNSSALNILRHLAGQGVVREEDVVAWRTLRPQAAHGHGINSDISDSEYQLCSRLYVLFYHLVFSIIGYSGSYSDYGQARAPNMDYGCTKT